MSGWEFATAGRVVFGPGALARAGALAAEHGSRVFLFSGAAGRFLDRAEPRLREAGVSVRGRMEIPGEPDLGLVRRAAEAVRSAGADLVFAIGGGSVIDAAKAAAALAPNAGDALDYLEVAGRGLPLEKRPLPVIACPTTAGTGAEVTRNAVIAVPERRVKASLRSVWMLPAVALVDPETTLSLPPKQTAWCGMDALAQLAEAFVSHAATPMSDAVCREGLRLAARALPAVCENGGDAAARADMAAASLMSGMALANAKLGAAHGFAGPLGGMFPAPHGALCAALLAPVCRANLARAGSLPEAEGRRLAERFSELGVLLCGDPDSGAAAEWIAELAARLRVPPLSSWGVARADYPEITAAAQQAGSMKGNPVALDTAALEGILDAAL